MEETIQPPRKPLAITVVEKLKAIFKCKTYHIEYALVILILIFITIVSYHDPVEWLGVLAVFFTFAYTSITNRWEEHERIKKEKNLTDTHIEWKLRYFFYAKEIFWFLYFLILGAWSALAGVFIFLIYPYWRAWWRKYHPIQEERPKGV